jgi:hypothetical protein
MSENERLDFVQNFWSKPNWDENDTQILEMIMEDGNDRLWEHCAQAFLKHPDRDRAVKFLIWRVEQCGTDHDPLNYIQALGISKDARAVPIIRPYFEKYRDEVEKEKAAGVPNDVVFGPIPCSAYSRLRRPFCKLLDPPNTSTLFKSISIMKTNKFDGGQKTL